MTEIEGKYEWRLKNKWIMTYILPLFLAPSYCMILRELKYISYFIQMNLIACLCVFGPYLEFDSRYSF